MYLNVTLILCSFAGHRTSVANWPYYLYLLWSTNFTSLSCLVLSAVILNRGLPASQTRLLHSSRSSATRMLRTPDSPVQADRRTWSSSSPLFWRCSMNYVPSTQGFRITLPIVLVRCYYYKQCAASASASGGDTDLSAM